MPITYYEFLEYLTGKDIFCHCVIRDSLMTIYEMIRIDTNDLDPGKKVPKQ